MNDSDANAHASYALDQAEAAVQALNDAFDARQSDDAAKAHLARARELLSSAMRATTDAIGALS